MMTSGIALESGISIYLFVINFLVICFKAGKKKTGMEVAGRRSIKNFELSYNQFVVFRLMAS